jgi:hypothetical protein
VCTVVSISMVIVAAHRILRRREKIGVGIAVAHKLEQIAVESVRAIQSPRSLRRLNGRRSGW